MGVNPAVLRLSPMFMISIVCAGCSIICTVRAFLSWISFSSNHFVGFIKADAPTRMISNMTPKSAILIIPFLFVISELLKPLTTIELREELYSKRQPYDQNPA